MFAGIMKRFAKDEDGAVTVDYVVLAAAVVAIALLVGASLRTGLSDAANGVVNDISTATFE